MPDPAAHAHQPRAEPARRSIPNVEALRWPAQDDRRHFLAIVGEPRLLLLAPNTPPPTPLDSLELCVPEDSPANVVVASVTVLQQRALAEHPEPVLDDGGLVWFRGRWVAVSDSQIPIVDLLVQNYERLVHVDDISRTYQDNGGSDSPASLRTLLRRVGRRLTKVGLQVHVVHRRGVVLAAADETRSQQM